MRITRQAVSKGYAVVAVSSADRAGSRCWELPDVHAATGGSGGSGGTDIKRVCVNSSLQILFDDSSHFCTSVLRACLCAGHDRVCSHKDTVVILS